MYFNAYITNTEEDLYDDNVSTFHFKWLNTDLVDWKIKQISITKAIPPSTNTNTQTHIYICHTKIVKNYIR
jgi:hypothetical protein